MIVVDTSALVDVLVAGPGSQALRDRVAGEDLLTDLEDLTVERWPALDVLRRRAFALRSSITACDAACVVLAEILGCPLVTRDGPLSRSSGHHADIELW